jgi:hypothetical protein
MKRETQSGEGGLIASFLAGGFVTALVWILFFGWPKA